MRQIMLIGKSNATAQNLMQILGKRYRMQLASDSVEAVAGLLKANVPDLILISTGEMEECHRDIFSHIQTNYSGVPVVYIGSKEELELFQEFEASEQFLAITRPVQMKVISQAILQKLSGGMAGEEQRQKTLPQERKKIFIIDDSAIQRNMMQNLLREQYNVMTAPSGKEAFSMMKTWLPDLILLDYDMPDCDGKEVFTMLQKEEQYCKIPVVFLTGVKERDKIQAVLGLKPSGYLLKPVEQSRLMDLLKGLL